LDLRPKLIVRKGAPRHRLDARYVDGDDGRYRLGSLHHHGSDRIRPQWLPPLPARKAPARPQPRPALSYLAFGRKFWRGKSGSQQQLARAAYWHDPKKEQRLKRCEDWEAAHLALLQEPYKLAPGRPWLRTWQSSTAPDWRTRYYERKAVLTRYYRWQELRPARYPDYGDIPPPGTQRYISQNGRPPPKARYVLCHYEQLFRWHEIRATVTSDHLRWTQWQEAVVSTTVGLCQGSIRWAGIQPTLAMIHTQLAVFNTSRRRVYRRHPPARQRNWQPPMQRPHLRDLWPVPTTTQSPLSARALSPSKPFGRLNLSHRSHCTQPL
jgi:hypothetical protein